MRLLFVSVFLSVFLYGVSAQERFSLQGTVHYEDRPLQQATVYLKNGAWSGTTDSAGRFTIQNLPAGRYHLFVSMTGFQEHHQHITVGGSQQSPLSILLIPNQASLSEVVVTGTMKAVQRSNSPIAVEVYNPQYFRKNPTPSIFESLQMVNGVRPQINCSVCNTGDIHINGLEGPYTMVTIDGMPIVSSLSSVYGLFGIPNQMIEKVEIIKGPASGLYGSEAIGGLINIITKDPSRSPKLSLQLMSTSSWEQNADAGVRWKMGRKAHALLGVNYFHYANPLDRNRDGFTDVTLQQRISLFNKWQFERKENRVASLAARYFYEDRWGGQMQWNKTFRGGDSVYGESIYTRRFEWIGNYQLPVRPKMMFSFSATAHNQDSYYGTVPYMADQRILFGQLTWNQALQRHDLLLGMAGRYNYYDDNSTATMDTATTANLPEQYFIPGIFLQDEWQLGSAHQLLMGLRVDHHPVHRQILTPRLAYKWKRSDRQTIRLNAGTGFRVVNLFTEDHAALTGSRAVKILEKLKPEKSYNINLHFSQQAGSASSRLLLDASAWYTYFHNQIIADYESDPNQIIYANLRGHAVSKGVSLNAEWNLKQRIKGSAGFTFQDVAKFEDYDGKKLKSRPMLTEKFSGTWAISYSFPLPGITVDYTGNVYGPMRLPLLSSLDPRRPESPVWSIQNIQVTKWVSGSLEIFGGIKNLLDWTPARNNPFLIARAHDPFDKKVEYDHQGQVLATPENPYGLSFDPSYVYASNQGLRGFVGLRMKLK